MQGTIQKPLENKLRKAQWQKKEATSVISGIRIKS